MRKRVLGLFVSALLCAVSAGAAPIYYAALLRGANEFPVNASPGTGYTTVIYDPILHTLELDVVFSGLIGNTTASHIHCCVSPMAVPPTVGVATTTPTFAGFPLGVTSGSYHNTLNLTLASSYNPAFITNNGGTTDAAETVLRNGLANGFAYLNIHSSQFPGGEIRGFLEPVPEPATFSLMAGGLGAVSWLRRKRRAPRR